MPRVSRAQTERNRVKITQTATRLFRERGFQNVSLSEVMHASGLTHGGFYGHFASKEALARAAGEVPLAGEVLDAARAFLRKVR